MDKDSTSIEQARTRWFIDLDWYQQNNRSFSALAKACLCPECHERLAGKAVSAEELLAVIRDCCSKKPGFITPKMPILGSVFRLLLANGNQPLNWEELEGQLREWRGQACASAEALSRLLSSDQYYGLRQVPD